MRARHHSAIEIEQRHLLQVREFRAADNLAGLVHVNETPGAFAGIHGVFVLLAQEMQLRQSLGEVIDRLRVLSSFVVIKANCPHILLAAPDGFFFMSAAILRRANLQHGGGQRHHDQNRNQRQEQSKTGFWRTPARGTQ